MGGNKEKDRYEIFERGPGNAIEDLFANGASRRCTKALAASVAELILIGNLAKFDVTISNPPKIFDKPTPKE